MQDNFLWFDTETKWKLIDSFYNWPIINIIYFPTRIKYCFFKSAERGKENWTSEYRIVDWWRRGCCRFGGHKTGVIFYNSGGYEPDMTCKGCGDYLG